MLTARALGCGRSSRHVVLQEISLTLHAGEVLGILGANGVGKSTLLSTLAGELPAQQGEITLHGTLLSQYSARELARHRAVLPQSAALNFNLPLLTLLEMGAYPFPELSPAHVHTLALDALGQVGLAHMAKRDYLTLSGGERQRAQFGRVLVQAAGIRAISQRPPLIFLDEPIASLDPRHQLGLLATARALAHQQHAALCIVLHDVNLAARHCDRIALLAEGRLIVHAPPAEALTPTHLAHAYGLPAQRHTARGDAERQWVEFVPDDETPCPPCPAENFRTAR